MSTLLTMSRHNLLSNGAILYFKFSSDGVMKLSEVVVPNMRVLQFLLRPPSVYNRILRFVVVVPLPMIANVSASIIPSVIDPLTVYIPTPDCLT